MKDMKERMKYGTKYSRPCVTLIVVVLLACLAPLIQIVPTVEISSQWLTGWDYRKSHVISPASGAGTNYQVRIKVNYGKGTDSGENVYVAGLCRSDFGDIRFTSSNGITLLDYWLQEKVDGSYAIFWVKVSDDLSSQIRIIYAYYGRWDATTTSNFGNPFMRIIGDEMPHLLSLSLEEDSGSIAYDKSGLGNNGTICRASWIDTTYGKAPMSNNPVTYIPKVNKYKGQLHVHTTNSDGSLTPIQVATLYRDAGYHFIFITDHNYLTPDLNVTGILCISGSEEATAEGHLTIHGVSSAKPRISAQEIINEVKAEGGLVSIAHPNCVNGWTDEGLRKVTGYNLIEIYNGKRSAEPNRAYALDRWQHVLSLGRRVWGVAVDDFHHIGQQNKGWIVVFADALTKAEIMESLRTGNFYSSTGADMEININITDVFYPLGVTVTTSAPSTIKWINKAGVIIKTTNNTTTDNYVIQPSDVFIRVEVSRGDPTVYAWSNPIYHPQYVEVLNNESPEPTHSAWGNEESRVNDGGVPGGSDFVAIYKVVIYVVNGTKAIPHAYVKLGYMVRVTDNEGKVVFTDVSIGSYQLTVTVDGQQVYQQFVNIDRDKTLVVDLSKPTQSPEEHPPDYKLTPKGWSFGFSFPIVLLIITTGVVLTYMLTRKRKLR